MTSQNESSEKQDISSEKIFTVTNRDSEYLTSLEKKDSGTEKTLSEREKDLIIRDLEVRTALMELKAEQRDLIERNNRFSDREKELLLRDLEVRTMLMEVKVAKEELNEKNIHLSGREKELIMRDLEVRTVLMELKVAQEQLVERHSELEMMMAIVKEINQSRGFKELLHLMLSQLIRIIPTAEKGAFLIYEPRTDDFIFGACYGYDDEVTNSIRLKRSDLEEFYMSSDGMVADGIYILCETDEESQKSVSEKKYFISRPKSALSLTISVGDNLKGLVFLDNFTAFNAFKTSDVDKAVRFREHAISAFLRTQLLEEVQQKNDCLAQQSQEIQEAFEELKQAQDKLILSEKMAALGQIISNLAHEVNTPIAAINAAAIQVLQQLPQLLEKLPVIFKRLDEKQEELFFELVTMAIKNNEKITTMQERKYRKEVAQELSSLKIEDTYSFLARDLIRCGVTSNLSKYKSLLELPDSHEVINAAGQMAKIRLHINNIVLSVTKAQRTITSYKTYTNDPNIQREATINLNESIEQCLNIYQNAGNDSLVIKVDFDEYLPSLICYPDQLAQVWNHLIHNALYAMEYKGLLEVKTYHKGGVAIIEFRNNGPAIPKEIQSKIIEPFFTTKPEGEGSGLGLHVCNKIIMSHYGRLEFTSEPGETLFRVMLPYNKFESLII